MISSTYQFSKTTGTVELEGKASISHSTSLSFGNCQSRDMGQTYEYFKFQHIFSTSDNTNKSLDYTEIVCLLTNSTKILVCFLRQNHIKLVVINQIIKIQFNSKRVIINIQM